MIHINDQLEFHLSTIHTSYIIKVLESGHLSLLHYGKKIRKKRSYSSLNQNYNMTLGSSTDYSKKTEHFTLDSTKLEVATYGKGDYKEPSLSLRMADGTCVSDFCYASHKTYQGKYIIEGMPHTFGGSEQVETLEVILYDEVIDVTLILRYGVFYEHDVITRSIEIVNGAHQTVQIEKIMTINIDMTDHDYELLTLDGKWIRERLVHSRPLTEGIFSIDSKKGVSSANHNPFMCLKRSNTDEHIGECYGFSLIYSGNHQGLVEVNPHGILRLQMGINPFEFSWTLPCGESFSTPEVVMTYSDAGLNKMSRQFHRLINEHLIPVPWQKKPRPILLNNWEATYFDFDEKKLMKLAKEAVKLGIELFVLDDGWFGQRNDDTSSLGDWYEDPKKLPHGLEGLSKKIRELGLDFGLWVEPEMVNKRSELYKKHPEWVIKLPNREPSEGRHQLMLDLSNQEVVNYLYDTLHHLFKRAQVSYVKWDMNRNISDLYSPTLGTRQAELSHRYVLGLYSLLERLKHAHPDILFESCASGGNRFDLGMLYYMPQTWTSDNTDAIERTYIQYGTSMVYPPSTMGAHVSGSPSHQVLRETPLETRFNVAAFGLLGYELDITALTKFQRKVISEQIAHYKRYRKLFQYGTFYRLQSPYTHNIMMWVVVSEERDEAILGYYQERQEPNGGFESLKLTGLKEDYLYKVTTRPQYMNVRKFGSLINEVSPIKIKANSLVHNIVSNNYLYQTEVEEIRAYGDELMYIGLRPYHQFLGTGNCDKMRIIGDYGSRLYHIKCLKKK